MVEILLPFVNDAIWIGLPNRLKSILKLNGNDAETFEKAEELVKIQSDAWVFGLYDKLRDNTKIRWKDSCKKILHLERPTIAGSDK